MKQKAFNNATFLRRGDFLVAVLDMGILERFGSGVDYPDKIILECFPKRDVNCEGEEFHATESELQGADNLSGLYHQSSKGNEYRLCGVFNKNYADPDYLAEAQVELNQRCHGNWKFVDIEVKHVGDPDKPCIPFVHK